MAKISFNHRSYCSDCSYIFSIYLSKISLESLIEMYDKQKKYSEFRIQFRITPIMLLSLGFLYSLLFYTLLEGIFDIMP